MAYRVIITDRAMRQFDRYLDYVVQTLKNRQAAASILRDFRQTANELSVSAGSMKYLDDPELAARGYRKLGFQRHNYLMIYRIIGDSAVVEAVFHTMQDYESALR